MEDSLCNLRVLLSSGFKRVFRELCQIGQLGRFAFGNDYEFALILDEDIGQVDCCPLGPYR